MGTPPEMASERERRLSVQLTAALAVVVVVVAIAFAFNSTFYTHWYAVFRVLHVVVAAFWVGGGLLLTALALMAQRKSNPEELAAVARQAAFVGERLFAPAGLVVLLSGIAMMINIDWGWGSTWIIIGLVGFAASFVTGVAVLAPRVRTLNELLAAQGPGAAETQAAIGMLLLIARVDVAVLVIVVADMVTKP